MNAIHRITGYDKRSERLEIEHDIPPDRLPDMRQLANVPPEDEDAIGVYPLDADAVRKVALKLDKPLNIEAYDWFLEPFASE